MAKNTMKHFYALLLGCLLSLNSIAQESKISNPTVIQGILTRISQPMEPYNGVSTDPDIQMPAEGMKREDSREWRNWFKNSYQAIPKVKDIAIQDFVYPSKKSRANNISVNFDGTDAGTNGPHDPSLCVGPNHVVQVTNGAGASKITVYNKSGVVVAATQNIQTISGVSGWCDPVACYDQMADRWLITEIADASNVLMIMVSQTNNPAGSYYVYSFTFPQGNDYPKYAVWPNAYIGTFNNNGNQTFAINRPAMLAGLPAATLLLFPTLSPPANFAPAAPVNISGTTMPPLGTTPIIMQMTDNSFGGGFGDSLVMWNLNLDFITPGNSSMVKQQPSISPAAFTTDLCGFSWQCIRQPNLQGLDELSGFIMNRVWYRNFDTYQSIVLSYDVDATGLDQAGIRWYELRRNGLGPWSIYQQSTFAPDTNSRWNSSIAINGAGDISLAYSLSSKLVFPTLKFTGRRLSDPLNTMTEPETVLAAGASSQSGQSRWGDYGDTQVDPADDFSFWTTGMYRDPASTNTRIAKFSILQAPLPVTLLSFEGSKNNDQSNLLTWKVVDEVNLDRYELERATIAEQFNTIYTENVSDGSNVERKYQYNDAAINHADNIYYRLKMIDQDGKFRYSNTVLINGQTLQQMQFYPNPVSEGTFYVRLTTKQLQKELHFTILNQTGEKVREWTVHNKNNEEILPVNVSTLPKGMYLVSCNNQQGTIVGSSSIIIK